MKLAILVLAAALGSASPTRRQNSTQGQDGQNACDCSEPFKTYALVSGGCPDGYEDISSVNIPLCAQIKCSADDYKAQCSAKAEEATPEVQEANPEAQEATPIAVAGKPTDEPTAPSEQKACDCPKPSEETVPETESCPDGYENISLFYLPTCVQISCSNDDYEAQCGAKQH